MKQRETWRVEIPEPYKTRLQNNQCPNCGKEKDKWKRRTDWTCCSKECSDEYYGNNGFTGRVIYSWPDVRKKAFVRDNYTCVKCKRKFPACDLIGDHIVPIALGGEEFELDNVQTLCIDCDKIKTKEDMKEITKARQIEKKLKDGQKQLKEEKMELKETTEKVSATDSFILTLRDKGNRMYNFTLPLINFATEDNMEKASLIFHKDMSQIEDKLEGTDKDFLVTSDYTDDPTPSHAGSIVSLGYPLIRVEFKNARITRFNPLVFEGKVKDLNVRFNREQRDSLINIPEHKEINKRLKLRNYISARSYYVIPRGFERHLYIISCITGEHNFNYISMVDMTSFYKKLGALIYHQRNRDSDKAINSYKDLIISWIKKQKKGNYI